MSERQEHSRKNKAWEAIKAVSDKISPFYESFALAIFAIWIVWRLGQIATGISLTTPDDSATRISFDLLQAAGFLLAWTALIFTVARIVFNSFRSVERRVERTSWEIDLHRSENQRILDQLQRMETQQEALLNEYQRTSEPDEPRQSGPDKDEVE